MASDKLKILLVDDDEMIQIYFRDIFWIHGFEDKYDVKVISDLEKARAAIHDPATRPNIIFLDLVMPMKKDGRVEATPEAGMSLLREIKEDPELKNIKVIIFSSYDDTAYKKKIEELGAERHLIKGDNLPKDIIDCVEQYAK